MKESVQLAIEAPADIAPRAAATIADLLASCGIVVGRTGSVVLTWPNPTLPSAVEAWGEHPRDIDADPIAFAYRHLHGRGGGGGWETPVDRVRDRVAEWARAERLLVASAWPEGATCAIALVHEARPFDRPATGLRGVLRRGPQLDPLDAYRAIAETEHAAGAVSAVRSADLLAPDEQAQVRMLGFSLATGANVRIASRVGFRRGTAFPTRGVDPASGRVEDWVELPLLGQQPDDGLTALLESGGGAALATPIADFHGAERAAAITAYGTGLERLRALGAWLTTPEELAQRLYGT